MCECPGNAMASYLYVLWALEDELVKIGTSRKLNKRLSAHTGNSSNPLNFERWKLYQFATISDARKIEILVLERLAKRGLSYRGKRELFKCSPTVAAAVIGELCSEAEIPVLRNFPFDLNEMLEALADFPSLPQDALQLLTSDQRKLYWKGARDALRCLSYFEGIMISFPDFSQIGNAVKVNEQTNSELWIAIVDHYRNLGLLGRGEHKAAVAKEIARAALEKIKIDRRFAYIDWQKLDHDDEPT